MPYKKGIQKMKPKKGLLGQNKTRLTTAALRRNALSLAPPQPPPVPLEEGNATAPGCCPLSSVPALLGDSWVASNGPGTLPEGFVPWQTRGLSRRLKQCENLFRNKTLSVKQLRVRQGHPPDQQSKAYSRVEEGKVSSCSNSKQQHPSFFLSFHRNA